MDAKTQKIEKYLNGLRLKQGEYTSRINGVIGITVFLLILFVGMLIIDLRFLNFTNISSSCINQIDANIQRLVLTEYLDQSQSGSIQTIDRLIIDLGEQEKMMKTYFSTIVVEDTLTTQITNLSISWNRLKNEIKYARIEGIESSNILEYSNETYKIAQSIEGLIRDRYNQRSEHANNIQVCVILDVLALTLIYMFRYVYYMQIKQNRDLLYKISYTDVATGIFNKSKCEELLSESSRLRAHCAMLFFDLNDLKLVNDTLGHDIGDLYIRTFANILKDSRKVLDEGFNAPFIGRFGGDEFLVYFETIEPDLIENYVAEIERLIDLKNKQNKTYQITYAVGIVKSNDYKDITTKYDLFTKADERMYEDKIEKKQKYNLETN